MKSKILLTLVILGVVGILTGYAFKEANQENIPKDRSSQLTPPPTVIPEAKELQETSSKNIPQASLNEEVSEYPKITTEIVNGRTERTIHMGVRQWVWEPSTLRAKQGELVRLVIHNADVNHPLYIPELGIEAEVPPEGAVVEFEANKKGSFFFLCGTYCGEGHAEMQGTLIIE